MTEVLSFLKVVLLGQLVMIVLGTGASCRSTVSELQSKEVAPRHQTPPSHATATSSVSSTVVKAFALFHHQYNNREYELIYDAATEEFRRRTSRDQWIKSITKWKSQCGTVNWVRSYHQNQDGNEGSKKITLDVATEFALGTCNEHFVWQVSDDKAELDDYYISSPISISR